MKNSILKILVAVTLVSFIGIGVSFADSGKNESGKRGYEHKDEGRDRDDYRKGNGKDDYHNHPGYRPKSRHDNYTHEHFNNYRYNGHWNSWNSWEQYKRSHPNYERHGHYERYNNQLFFMFNDGVNAFSFSIGR